MLRRSKYAYLSLIIVNTFFFITEKTLVYAEEPTSSSTSPNHSIIDALKKESKADKC